MSVSFKTVNKSGKTIKNYFNAPCYADIVHDMGAATDSIHVYWPKKAVNYNFTIEQVRTWINDLNEMGFPILFVDEDVEDQAEREEKLIKATVLKTQIELALKLIREGEVPAETMDKSYVFVCRLDDYLDKNHLFSALALIRCLIETTDIAKRYFGVRKDKPDLDKLEALQVAHKSGYGASGGHCVTYKGNGSNVDKKTLLERFKKSGQGVRSGGYTKINQLWNGNGKMTYAY